MNRGDTDFGEQFRQGVADSAQVLYPRTNIKGLPALIAFLQDTADNHRVEGQHRYERPAGPPAASR